MRILFLLALFLFVGFNSNSVNAEQIPMSDNLIGCNDINTKQNVALVSSSSECRNHAGLSSASGLCKQPYNFSPSDSRYLSCTGVGTPYGYILFKYISNQSGCPSSHPYSVGTSQCTDIEPFQCPASGERMGDVWGASGLANHRTCQDDKQGTSTGCMKTLTLFNNEETCLPNGECYYQAFSSGESCAITPDAPPILPPDTPNTPSDPNTPNDNYTPSDNVTGTGESSGSGGSFDSNGDGVQDSQADMNTLDGQLLAEQQLTNANINTLIKDNAVLTSDTNKLLTSIKNSNSVIAAKSISGGGGGGGGDSGNDNGVESSECTAAFQCSGDVLQCALLKIAYNNTCINDELDSLESSLTALTSVDNVAAIVQADTVDLGQINEKYLNNGVIASGQCPKDKVITFTIFYKTVSITIPYQPLCDLVTGVAPAVIIMGWFMGIVIIGRGQVGNM